MVQFLNLPGYQSSPLLDLSPLAQGLAMRQRAQEAEAKRAMAERKMAEDARQFNLGNERSDKQLALQEAQARREAALDPLRQRQLETGIKLQERQLAAPIDDGSKVLEVNGQIFRVPRQGNAEAIGGSNATDVRHTQALQLGLQPGSPEYVTLMTNGKLPAAFYEQHAQKRLRQESAPKIAAGLRNMAKMTDRYDDASFTNAVGPFQGSEPDSLIGAAGVNTARLGGEILNRLPLVGGNTAPTEVRSNIKGSTEALAAAIKPLIRGPGEGVWTDADQARLVAVVGDLATASTKEEYRRRLNDVRDRVKANFGLDINFDALPKQPGRLAPGQVSPGTASPQGQGGPVPRVNSVQEAMRLPKGTKFIDPKGVLREVP